MRFSTHMQSWEATGYLWVAVCEKVLFGNTVWKGWACGEWELPSLRRIFVATAFCFPFNQELLLLVCLSVCVPGCMLLCLCVCVLTPVHLPWHESGGQRTTLGGWVLFSTMDTLEVGLSSLGLAAMCFYTLNYFVSPVCSLSKTLLFMTTNMESKYQHFWALWLLFAATLRLREGHPFLSDNRMPVKNNSIDSLCAPNFCAIIITSFSPFHLSKS